MPVDSLPVEILTEVFLLAYALAGSLAHAGDADRAALYNALAFSWVSGRWRQIALSTPRLWSSIPVVFRGSSFDSKVYSQTLDVVPIRVQTQLDRSASAPLDVSIMFQYVRRLEDAFLLWDVILPHLGRCRKLSLGLHIFAGGATNLNALFPLPALPRIEHIGIGCYRGVTLGSVFQSQHSQMRLKTLSLSNVILGPILEPLPVYSVDHLTLTAGSIFASGLSAHLEWLRHWPGAARLQSLDLLRMQDSLITLDGVIHLPNLHSLRAPLQCLPIFASLSSLHSLTVDIVAYDIPHVTKQIPNLQSLHIVTSHKQYRMAISQFAALRVFSLSSPSSVLFSLEYWLKNEVLSLLEVLRLCEFDLSPDELITGFGHISELMKSRPRLVVELPAAQYDEYLTYKGMENDGGRVRMLTEEASLF